MGVFLFEREPLSKERGRLIHSKHGAAARVAYTPESMRPAYDSDTKPFVLQTFIPTIAVGHSDFVNAQLAATCSIRTGLQLDELSTNKTAATIRFQSKAIGLTNIKVDNYCWPNCFVCS